MLRRGECGDGWGGEVGSDREDIVLGSVEDGGNERDGSVGVRVNVRHYEILCGYY